MPANRVIESIYLGPFTSAEAFNSSTLYKQGELGARVATTGGKEYQLVQLDSGATSANTVGIVAVGQVAYWKDKSRYLVTNDNRVCVGGQSANSAYRNEVAGIFRVAVTPGAAGDTSGGGYYCFVQQKGNCTNVVSKSLTAVKGYQIVGDNTSNTAQVDIVASGTAVTVQSLGKCNQDGSTITSLNVDLDVPGIP
jgi:hypothetical protein